MPEVPEEIPSRSPSRSSSRDGRARGSLGELDVSLASEEAVDQFLVDNLIDDSAASDLKSLPIQLQSRIIEQGPLAQMRNPSAALIVRIRDTKRNRSGSLDSLIPVTPEELERFLATSGVDESAANDLRGSSAQIQSMVLSEGDLSTARNPSASLIGRIRDAKKRMTVRSPSRDGFMPTTEADVEKFLQNSGTDDKAANDLRAQTPEVQAFVISKGSLHDARNPSAALITRIRDAKRQRSRKRKRSRSRRRRRKSRSRQKDREVTSDQLEMFIQASKVDDKAANDLRICTASIQRRVLTQGDLASARNPSAALIARIRDAKKRGPSRSRSRFHDERTPQELINDVDRFLEQSGVDESAANDLRACSAEVQAIVLQGGDLSTARQPSAALIGRIRDAKKSAGGRELCGDWKRGKCDRGSACKFKHGRSPSPDRDRDRHRRRDRRKRRESSPSPPPKRPRYASSSSYNAVPPPSQAAPMQASPIGAPMFGKGPCLGQTSGRGWAKPDDSSWRSADHFSWGKGPQATMPTSHYDASWGKGMNWGKADAKGSSWGTSI